MRALRSVVVLAVAICGCGQPKAGIAPVASTETRSDFIHVGMNFEKAHATLMERGAEDFMLQVLLEVNPEHPERDLHYYQLPSGPTIEIISESTEAGRVVASMRVSTYTPKSDERKRNEEQDKFIRSFRDVKELDLDNPPEPASMPAVPSARQRAGHP